MSDNYHESRFEYVMGDSQGFQILIIELEKNYKMGKLLYCVVRLNLG